MSKNLDNVGDGLQFVFKIIKTPITNGTQGTPADLTPIATTSTTPVSGKYVCSVPVPISIKKGSFAVGTTLTVKLDGIGEGLSGVTVSMAPEVQLTLNNDGTITVKPIEGYAFDKLTAGNTGAYYDVIINSATTYSVAAPIVPLANGTVLWSGAVMHTGDISLTSKLNADYSNVGSGLKFTLDGSWKVDPKYEDGSLINGSEINFDRPLSIAKEDLIVGKTITFTTTMEGKKVHFIPSSDSSSGLNINGDAQLHVLISANKLSITTDGIYESSLDNGKFYPTITQITTYLN